MCNNSCGFHQQKANRNFTKIAWAKQQLYFAINMTRLQSIQPMHTPQTPSFNSYSLHQFDTLLSINLWLFISSSVASWIFNINLRASVRVCIVYVPTIYPNLHYSIHNTMCVRVCNAVWVDINLSTYLFLQRVDYNRTYIFIRLVLCLCPVPLL